MVKIELFNSSDMYKGFSRVPFIIRFGNIRELDTYFSLLEDEFIPFTLDNLQKITELYNSISKRKKGSEIIVCGEFEQLDYSMSNPEKVTFLGYDICGDSMYISFVKDILFNEQDTPTMAHMHKYFRDQLNENGLFDSRDDALPFLKHIYEFGNMYEKDGNLKLLSIFKIIP